MNNWNKFSTSNVGTTGISYKWDIRITLNQFKFLKQHIQEYYQNGCSCTFIKDHFKETYYICVFCYFDISPFNSESDAEKYMLNDSIYILYSKHPMLTELNSIRYEILKSIEGE